MYKISNKEESYFFLRTYLHANALTHKHYSFIETLEINFFFGLFELFSVLYRRGKLMEKYIERENEIERERGRDRERERVKEERERLREGETLRERLERGGREYKMIILTYLI